MSFKKILAAVMASCVACGAFAVSAVELDVAESANEAVVADAVLAASLFHYKEMEIMDLKRYLAEKNIPVRMG